MKLYLQTICVSAMASIATATLLPQQSTQGFKVVPTELSNDSIVASYVSSQLGLDGPRLSAINESSFDWWYFDAVAEDAKTSFAVVFYQTGPKGAGVAPQPSANFVTVYAQFPNGSLSETTLLASEAVILTQGDGSSGVFKDSGAEWVGAPDLSWYRITLDAPEQGIVGTFDLRSVAPAHYPCSPVAAGQNLEVGPHIGWSNAMPDAVGIVDVKIYGTSVSFTGVAYHDKNWSDQPLAENVGLWYWGHGRLGDYSIVWFDFVAFNGTELFSAYVAKNGEILASSCAPGSILVRPFGGDDTFPPLITSGFPDGFNIKIDLGSKGMLETNVTIVATTLDVGPTYRRFVGTMEGNVDGGETLTGPATFEEFKFLPANFTSSK